MLDSMCEMFEDRNVVTRSRTQTLNDGKKTEEKTNNSLQNTEN